MNKLLYKTTAGLTGAALLLGVVAPVAFAADNEISGNGAGSRSRIIVSDTNTTSVGQSNSSTVGNSISSSANTGGNKVTGTTGGDVSVTTGDASNTTTVTTTTGGNVAHIASCCGCSNGGSNLISRNGVWTKNKIQVTSTNTLGASQENSSTVGNNVYSKAKTGKNKARNTTNGSVDVTTGNSDNMTDVMVTTGSNMLTTTGCCQSDNCEEAVPPGI